MRRAGPGDAEAIRALTRLAYAKLVPLIGREPLPMAADYDRAVREHLVDLWEEDGALVALVEMIPGEDFLMIENLAVHPAHQGRGLGGKLLAHAEAVARASGSSEVQLYTNEVFAENVAFYEKKGYTLFKRAPFKGGVVVSLKKRLV